VATLQTPLSGDHNARNALAAIVLCLEVCGLDLEVVARGLAGFRGVALRQQLLGTRGAVRVFRDFAHHPEAVAQTLRAMQPVSGTGRLFAAYEPRTATACRTIHQAEYVDALAEADEVVLAPVARTEIPEGERLDTDTIARQLRAEGTPATAATTTEEVVEALARRVRPGDLVLMLSNGHFGGAPDALLERLGEP
jgi:UDP-N-acetylmuramate: L-alanyl-gamma-D-glutamyl-meso-diaminopimelate ligase